MAKEKDDTETTTAEAAAKDSPAEAEDTAGNGEEKISGEAKDEENQQDTPPTNAADAKNGNDDGGEEPPADDPPSDGDDEEEGGGGEKGGADEGEDPSEGKTDENVEDKPTKESKQDDAAEAKAKTNDAATNDDDKGDETKEDTNEKKDDEKKSPDPPEDGDDDEKTEKVIVSETTEKKSSDDESKVEEDVKVAAPSPPKKEQEKETVLKTVNKKDDESTNTNPFAIDDEIEGEVEVKPTPDWADEEKDPAPVAACGDNENGEDKKKKKSKKSAFFFSKKKESSDLGKGSDGNEEEKPAGVPTPPPAVHHDDEAVVKFDGKGGVSIVGIHISEMRLPLVGMFLSAAVLLVAVLVYKGPGLQKESYRNYAISVPSATMCLSFLMMIMTCKEEFYTTYGKIPNQIVFLWNFVGACLLTFSGPFETTGNGYFAAWFICIFSAAALGFTASTFKSTIRGMGAHMGLFCSSIIVVIAIVPWLGKDSLYRYEAIYTMCVAVVTLVMNLVLTFRQKTTEGRAARGCEGIVGFVVLSIFAIMWVVLAGLATFRGPFLKTGNGYFSSWIGAACACFAAFASRRKSKAEALAKSKKDEDLKPDGDWAEEDDSPV